MEDKKFVEEMRILNHDVDFRGRLTPAALLRHTEQIASDHADADGIGAKFLGARGLAMLIGKQALRFDRVPTIGEKLTLTTRGERCRHAMVKRITTVADEAGRQVALVDARWIIVDMNKARILREAPWDTSPFWHDALPEELPQSVHRSAERLESAGTYQASYSICDENGHLNNSHYLDIACDALPLDELRRAPVTFAAIKYDRQVPLGESMEVLRAPSGDGWYVAGRRDGKNAFECYMELG